MEIIRIVLKVLIYNSHSNEITNNNEIVTEMKMVCCTLESLLSFVEFIQFTMIVEKGILQKIELLVDRIYDSTTQTYNHDKSIK